MSIKEEEKQKEEIIKESTEKEKEKTNMKITLITKVIIKGSLLKIDLKEEIWHEKEKEILKNKAGQKSNDEKCTEEEKKKI